MLDRSVHQRDPMPLRPALSGVLAGLCFTELVSWGLLYYAFPVLAPNISDDTGWSPQLVSAGFSLGLIASALLGVVVGRHIDRHGPRMVMTVGSLLAAVGLVIVASSQHPVMFTVGWLGRVSYIRSQTRIAANTTPARYVTASLS